jgi:hypothetical protein
MDVSQALVSGLSTANSSAIVTTDSVLTALGKAQAQLNLSARLANATLTGVPTAPTAIVTTNTTQIATTAFVTAAVAASATSAASIYATLANPTFTGTVTIPGGSIDHTTIGASGAAAGTFTTLNITSLPTSPEGLATGAIWNDGGVLTIA